MRIILLVVLIFIGLKSVSQVYKFKCFQVAEMYRANPSKLEWEFEDVLVVINTPKKKIIIYTDPIQEFDIVSASPVIKDKNNDSEVKFVGIDEKGLKCKIKAIIFVHSTGIHKATLICEYKNYFTAYRLRNNN